MSAVDEAAAVTAGLGPVGSNSPPTGHISVAPKRQRRKLPPTWCLGDVSLFKRRQICKNFTPASVLDTILCLSFVKPSPPRGMDVTWQNQVSFPAGLRQCWIIYLQWLWCVDCGPLHKHLNTNLCPALWELRGASFPGAIPATLVELAQIPMLVIFRTSWNTGSSSPIAIKWLYAILRSCEKHLVFTEGVVQESRVSHSKIPFIIKWGSSATLSKWLGNVCQRWWNDSRSFGAFIWNVLLGLNA